MTGSAAININGETTHKACSLNCKLSNIKRDDEWVENACLLIVDEISFASNENLTKLNQCLNLLCDQPSHKLFGDIPMVFVGDFSQLKPVAGKSLLDSKSFALWRDQINTFLELKTNHRFHQDPEWGQILQHLRSSGPTKSQVEFINSRIVGPFSELPENIAYATYNNIDKCSINEGIFSEFLKTTHSKSINDDLPDHTIVIKASNLKLHVSKTTQYRDMPQLQQHCLLTGCSDANVVEGGDKGSRRIDPLLKLYVGRPVMINHNIDVESSKANGAMCTFKSIKLKNGFQDCDIIKIDGYYVRCVDADMVDYMEVILTENNAQKVLELKPTKCTAQADFPCPTAFETEITHKTTRMKKRIQLRQFPINIANARTVHKLQGRSIENLFVSTWSYTSNWIYVVLSRVKTSKGLFTRIPLLHSKTNTPENMKDITKINEFHAFSRRTKKP
jgi:hypothetical protein